MTYRDEIWRFDEGATERRTRHRDERTNARYDVWEDERWSPRPTPEILTPTRPNANPKANPNEPSRSGGAAGALPHPCTLTNANQR